MTDPIPLALSSPGRATDGAWLAAGDLAGVAERLEVEYRLVGGNAVTLLAAAYGVTHLVPARETADADFGASFRVVADPRLVDALVLLGYRRAAGNRFVRTIRDPVGALALTVDILAPSYEARMISNRPHGDLVVDEVPGLALALARSAVVVAVDLTLTSGDRVSAVLMLPDGISALCLKALSYAGRFAERDAVDLWRLLEVARAAGITGGSWPEGPTTRDAAAAIRRHFGTAAASGVRAASESPADQARIRALVAEVVPRDG